MKPTNVFYTLSINFNYDSENHMIIESRCIKREYQDSNNKSNVKQYIKGNLKEYSAELTPEIYNELQNVRVLILEKKLTIEQVKLTINKNFNLFDDIQQILSDTDSEEILEKINLSPAI